MKNLNCCRISIIDIANNHFKEYFAEQKELHRQTVCTILHFVYNRPCFVVRKRHDLVYCCNLYFYKNIILSKIIQYLVIVKLQK